jgi:UDP-N-acetylmuramoyl-L-alanyl-D-glutamate--2,6-diaminopimelate ligase
MKLSEIIKNIDFLDAPDPEYQDATDISGISINSKKVKEGFLFIAIPGFKKDGHDYAKEAVANGAKAVMFQRYLDLPTGIHKILVKDCRKEMAVICRNFYKNPTSEIILTGITGTNGKTTSVFLLDSVFKSAGFLTSYITTVKAEISGVQLSFDRTTPDSLDLNEFFANGLSRGVEAASMEVSSHSIDLHRVDWLEFDYFLFTNLTQDHLDYHENMENYFTVKNRLFSKSDRYLFGGKAAAINIDDNYGKKIASSTDLKVLTYGINDRNAMLSTGKIKSSIDGIEMEVALNDKRFSTENYNRRFLIKSPLCGYFNVSNILGVIGIGILANIGQKYIQEGVISMPGVSGRFEKIQIEKEVNVIVDYAHTPDGLDNVLRTARSLLPRGAKLISVFGCGGDRDTKKRKIMGGISAGIADFTIITSDNPRNEDPESIIRMIEEGFTLSGNDSYIKITDRKEAILKALEEAKKNDIVLIAGKGHEDYQEFADRKIHFSDQEVVKDWGGL